MAIGPLAGGWVFDRFGRYAWMYISAATIGGAVVLLSLMFPRGPAMPRGALAAPA